MMIFFIVLLYRYELSRFSWSWPAGEVKWQGSWLKWLVAGGCGGCDVVARCCAATFFPQFSQLTLRRIIATIFPPFSPSPYLSSRHFLYHAPPRTTNHGAFRIHILSREDMLCSTLLHPPSPPTP
jgi:hypothetical protein